MKRIKTFESYNSEFEKFMLEWNGYDENDKWNSSNTLITKTLKEINDYIDENKLTLKDNLYKIKGWKNNKWEILVSSNYKK